MEIPSVVLTWIFGKSALDVGKNSIGDEAVKKVTEK